MRNPEGWRPSKYVHEGGRWTASGDRAAVGTGSWLIASRVAALYAEHLPRVARGRLVDLGCGAVPLYAMYRPHVGAITCADWPASAHGSAHVDVACDLNQPLPFADASFETAICADVLEHLPRPEHLWREAARVLSAGGRLVLNVPFLYGIHEAPHDYGRYTAFALRRFAAEAGLEVELLTTVGGSAHVFADLGAKHLAKLPLVGPALAWAVQRAVAAIDRTAPGRRFAAASGERFPLGYFMVATKPAAG